MLPREPVVKVQSDKDSCGIAVIRAVLAWYDKALFQLTDEEILKAAGITRKWLNLSDDHGFNPDHMAKVCAKYLPDYMLYSIDNAKLADMYVIIQQCQTPFIMSWQGLLEAQSPYDIRLYSDARDGHWTLGIGVDIANGWIHYKDVTRLSTGVLHVPYSMWRHRSFDTDALPHWDDPSKTVVVAESGLIMALVPQSSYVMFNLGGYPTWSHRWKTG